jgi:hypothetical protein
MRILLLGYSIRDRSMAITQMCPMTVSISFEAKLDRLELLGLPDILLTWDLGTHSLVWASEHLVR